MTSNITSILTLPQEILENKIYKYVGNDGVSLFQSTNKKNYLGHQDKASAETPLLKLNDLSQRKILGFMSLGDKLKLSRTNSTMRRKWKHEYIDLLDIINLIPMIGNIQTQMNNTQEGIFILYIKIAQNILNKSTRTPEIDHAHLQFESYFHLMINPVKLALILKFFPDLINNRDLLEESLSVSVFSSLPFRISLDIVINHPNVFTQLEKLNESRAYDITFNTIPLILQNAIKDIKNIKTSVEKIKSLYGVLPQNSGQVPNECLRFIDIIKKIYNLRDNGLIEKSKFKILEKHIEVSLYSKSSIVTRFLYLEHIFELYSKIEKQIGSEIYFPSKIDLIKRLKKLSLEADKHDESSFITLYESHSKLNRLFDFEERIDFHIECFQDLYTEKHQLKLGGAITTLKANLNYLYFLQLSSLDSLEQEQPERKEQYLTELNKFKLCLREHMQKVEILSKMRHLWKSICYEIQVYRPNRRNLGSHNLQGPPNRVVTKSGLFGFFKIVETTPFCGHHFHDDYCKDSRLVIGGKFSISLQD